MYFDVSWLPFRAKFTKKNYENYKNYNISNLCWKMQQLKKYVRKAHNARSND